MQAPTLLLTDDHAPSSSPHLKMPQVFVVPPEEDDTPAWCCFDANMPPSASTSASYADSPHHVLDMLRKNVDMPLLHYDFKEPRSLLDTVPSDRETRSIKDAFIKDDYMELDNEMGSDTEELEQYQDPEASVGNDSEVVEVVKVGRYAADVEEHFRTSTPPAHTSKSLKARAVEVFRILTNADKDPRRSRSKAQVILPPADEGTQTKKTKAKSSHSSTNSSPLFHPSMTPPTSPSVSSFDLAEVSSTPPFKGPRYPLSLRNVSFSSAQPCPLGPLTSSSAVSPDFRSPFSTSPTRPISNRRHFSMTLNRIFSSKSDKVLDVFPVSGSDLGLLTQSSSEPEIPIEEVASLNPEYTLLPSQKGISTGDSALDEGDFGCEMRLGSLHFDSLSFDVDMF